MSIFSSIVRRQLGFEGTTNYDVAVQRLKCYSTDVYRGVTPNHGAPDFNPEPPIFACRFCPIKGHEQYIALANEDGNIALQDTTKKGQPNEQLQGHEAHRNAIFDLSWMPKEMKLVTASGDHSARLWDVTPTGFNLIQSFVAHTRSVKNVVFRQQDNAVFATGARDGVIMVWDTRANHGVNPKPDNCMMNAHAIGKSLSNSAKKKCLTPASRSQSITGLAFQDDFTLISCSAGDGLIKVWDLRKNYSVHKKDPMAKHVLEYSGGSTRNGFTSLQICPAGIRLYASCMDNTIYAYNISTYSSEPIAEYFGNQTSTFYIKSCLSPDGQYLLSGSSDIFAYLWRTDKPGKPLVRLAGHSAEVTCVTWCSVGETKIVTCSDDTYHRIWKVGIENSTDDERHDLHGQAEPVTMNEIAVQRIHRTQRTPTIRRRRSPTRDRTPSSGNGRGTSPMPNPEDSASNCDSSQENHPRNSQKRTYAEMTGEASTHKAILSPIQENSESSSKRAHTETRGARRLFSPENNRAARSREIDIEEAGPSTSRQSESPDSHFSPTSNLPNFVIDGTAPHLNESSPRKSKENVDWLTKIRKEKMCQKKSEQKTKGSAEKVVNSPKTPQVTPARRSSRSKSTEARSKTPKSPAGPLLNFFKSTNAHKDCEKETPQKSKDSPRTSPSKQ
ncbi:protein lethal(2)denticleless [Belonocnema kinseyi]|uniref:protein lethal(2)denticleless n=1 Tax=Belonocnema kinseyi TaxID=2817044 RepID=UPI00143CF3AE|nr:protein lethal(2)denticleless [Belonocnema kinseyi]